MIQRLQSLFLFHSDISVGYSEEQVFFFFFIGFQESESVNLEEIGIKIETKASN